MLPIGLSYMAYIMLRFVPSMPTFWRVFIINRCWILSKAFSAFIEMTILFLFINLLMWSVTRIDLWILKIPCISGINPTWSLCMILLMYFFLIYLFMAVLGLHFCVRGFSSCGKQGSLFIAVHGPLTIVASLVVEHRLQTRRLGSCGSRT